MLRIVSLTTLVLSVVAGISYWYYTDSQERMAQLLKSLGEQSLKIENLHHNLTALRTDAENLKRNTEAFHERLNEIRLDTARQLETIQKHDLRKIGAAHPQMLEDRINRGTEEMFKRLEDLSK